MFSRCKHLSPLQRKTLLFMSGAMMLTILTNFSDRHTVNPLKDIFPALGQLQTGHPSPLLASILSAVAVFPVLLAVWAAARYLKSEPDEFIRAIAVKALLWGFAVTMAGDAIVGVLITAYGQPFPLSVMNADLFFASTGIAFRVVQWSYR
jgi:hypothetical protein